MEMHDSKELRVGDRVRTLAGLTGTVVVLNHDGVTAYVQLRDLKPGTAYTRLRLEGLTKV